MRGIFASKNQKECNEISTSSSFKFDFTLQESDVLQTNVSTKKKKNKKAKRKKKSEKSGIPCSNTSEISIKDGEDTASESEHEQIINEDSVSPRSMIVISQTDDVIQSTELNSHVKVAEPNGGNGNQVSDKKKKKKKKKSAKNKSKQDVSDDDFEHVINEFKSANISSYLNEKDSDTVAANSTKAVIDGDKQPRDKSIPHFLSANDPELSEEAKRQAKYGNGKNLVAIGPAKKKDVTWLESKQSDSNFNNCNTTSHHCSPFTFSFNGILFRGNGDAQLSSAGAEGGFQIRRAGNGQWFNSTWGAIFFPIHPLVASCSECGFICCEKDKHRVGVASRNPCPSCGTGTLRPPMTKDMAAAAHYDSATVRAYSQKDKLLLFDREHAKRTHVHDAQADYYESSAWLTAEEKKQIDDKLRKKK
eukprot:gene30048-39907_t